jgi:lipid-binding SYLF domain-containing protein
MLLFMTANSSRSLTESGFTLGAKASVAAGPVGRSAEAGASGTEDAEIYTYARTQGLFAGISFEGASLSPHWKANQMFYEAALRPEEILFERAIPRLPGAAEKFMAALP